MLNRLFVFMLILSLLMLGAPTESFAADTVAPSISLKAPWISTKISKTTTFKVSWKANDPAPSEGIASYTVRFREARSSAWENWKTNTKSTYGYFRGSAGRTYLFRVLVKDNAGNARWSKVRQTIIPYNETQLMRDRSGFAPTYKSRSSRFFQGSLRYSTQPQTWIKYRFFGNSVGLVSTKASDRGRAKIYIDGKHVKTVDAHATKLKPRQIVYYRTWKSPRTHFIKIENLGTPGRSRFDVDGLAVGNSSVPFSLSGNGSVTTRRFTLGKGLATFKLSHSGQANFTVWLRNSKGEFIDLLTNEIGATKSAAAINVERDGQYLIDVDADGPWDISIAQPRRDAGISTPVKLTGRGDRVTRFVKMNAGLKKFRLTHDGGSNFIVWLLDEDGRLVDLLANEIGAFSGSALASFENRGFYILDISADGNWSVDIQ